VTSSSLRDLLFAACAAAALLCFALLTAAEAAAAERKEKDAKRQGSGLGQAVAEKLLRANDLLAKERYDDALEIVDRLAKRRRLKPPETAQIHRFRGYIYVNKSRIEPAAQELQKALDARGLDPGSQQLTTYSLAQLYTQLGQFERALALIETWFESAEDPKPDAYYLKAMILVQQDRFDAALEPARTAVERSPKPRESWLQLLAAIHIQRKDYPNVAATLERLVEAAPGNHKYWVQLAAVQHFLERDAKALATLALADTAELLKDDKEYRQLARLLFLRELPFQCGRAIEEGIAAGAVQADADSYRLMANCYVAARETERALEPLAKAGALSDDGETYVLLAQIHLQRERYEPALQALGKALAKAGPEQQGPVRLLMGVAQIGEERFDDAERSFRAATGDERVRKAADSYLAYLEERRARDGVPTPIPAQTASGG
jgi:tetratricopeptide (TPR) repeat protein